MNFISTFEELNKLYEEASHTEELTEGKVIDSIKKVATRLGADAATIVRAFAELLPGDAAYEAAVNAENKAVLKALQSGNEKVLNSLTIEDIEELKQDIEEYAAKKAESDSNEIAEDDDLDEGIFGFGNKKKNTATAGKSGKYDAAYAKALEKTPVVIKLWRDGSHKPEIVDYFDSNLAAEGVVKRHANDADKSVVYRYMMAKEAEQAGALVSVPSRFVNKYLNEEVSNASNEETTIIEAASTESIDEEVQFVLECSKCGGLIIKAEADCKVDEEESLVNIGDTCQYCEAVDGYTILGTLVPYEEEIEIEPDEDEDEAALEEAVGSGRHYIPRDIKYAIEKARAQFNPDVNGEISEADALKIAKNIIDDPKFKKYTSSQEAGQAYNTMFKFIQTGKTPTDLYWDDFTELTELLDFEVPISVTANGNDVAVGGLA